VQNFSSEIANETVTDAELKVLLHRLSAADLGGSDLPRIKDIAEATNQTPEAVALLLAEMRGETSEEWRQAFQSN